MSLTDEAIDYAAAALAVALNGGDWYGDYTLEQRVMWRDRVRGMMSEAAEVWTPPPKADRPDGFRCLAFHRGKWRDVVWVASHRGWMTHFGSEFFLDGQRQFAPLPPLPEGHENEFWDWKL